MCPVESDQLTAWVHAYLHGKEGDLGNAAHWVRRAGKPVETGAWMPSGLQCPHRFLRSTPKLTSSDRGPGCGWLAPQESANGS
jgi:hypothetical protein